jgi:hypothetical protein
LGDFWNIRNVYPDMDHEAGVSMVLLNTPTAENSFEEIKQDIISRQCHLSDALQRNLIAASSPAPKRSLFMKDLQHLPFQVLVDKYFVQKSRLTVEKASDFSTVKAYWCELMKRLKLQHGCEKIAFYCAGDHTAWLLNDVLPKALWPAFVFDEITAEKHLPVPTRKSTALRGEAITAIVVSSDAHHSSAVRRLLTMCLSELIIIVDPYDGFPAGFIAPKGNMNKGIPLPEVIKRVQPAQLKE